MGEDEKNIGRIEAMLEDARIRIKESEERAIKRTDELERKIDTMNQRLSEWTPLLVQLSKQEDTKRQVVVASTVNLIANIAAWILLVFMWFVKNGK